MPLLNSNARRSNTRPTSFVVVSTLILCAAANLWAAPAGESASQNDINLEALLDIYRKKEADFQTFELHWKEEVVQRKENGAYDRYLRQWKIVVDGDRVRTEERGISDAKHPENPNSLNIITAFDGKVGKRLAMPEGSALRTRNPLGSIYSEDLAQPFNSGILLPAMVAFRPHKVLIWQKFSPTPWKMRKAELERQSAIILNRKTHSGSGIEQELYVDPSNYTIKRVVNTSPAGNHTQWDLKYRSEVTRESELAGWTWTSFDERGKVIISRTTQSVLIRKNLTVLPKEFDLIFSIGTMVTEGSMIGEGRNQKTYVIGPDREQQAVRE